jgi:hypothetical protein
MNPWHEVYLQSVIVTLQAEQLRRRVIGLHDGRAKEVGESPQLAQIPRRFAETEIEIDSGHRRALQRGRGVADENASSATR